MKGETTFIIVTIIVRIDYNWSVIKVKKLNYPESQHIINDDFYFFSQAGCWIGIQRNSTIY